jgi:4-diphosphocytidyl-2-C-methyl-D-erythritol kinase
VNQPSLSLPSFAKINWSLQILGKRPDGYHEVKTILQTISLHDDIHFEVTSDFQLALTCDSADIPTDDTNLIIRAAQALKTRYDIERGARIRLEKRIPTQAGLGGASSNAAVALLALAKLWKIDATPAAQLEIAAGLGADVPFFLMGGAAQAEGIGATVSPLADSHEFPLIVIKPNAAVLTAEAYAAVSSSALTTMNTATILSSLHKGGDLSDSFPWPLRNDGIGHLRNDFESVIFDIDPEIGRTKEALLEAGALGALLAGSGSSVFGIFADRETQRRALDKIQTEAGWRVFPCVTVSRNEYVKALGFQD